MNWKELKHEINMEMVDFRRAFDLKGSSNVLILGKKEYEILQGEEARIDFCREDELADTRVNRFTFGEVAQLWGMRVCRVNIDSIVKIGHIV